MTRARPHPAHSVALTAAGLAAVLNTRDPARLRSQGRHVDLHVTPAGEAWLAFQAALERALAQPTVEHRRAQWCRYRAFVAIFAPAETPAAIDARHAELADYAKRLNLTAEDLRCVTP